MTDAIRHVISQPAFLIIWGLQMAVALVVLIYDLRKNNAELGSLMKFVWGLTVAYSGLLGLAIYFYSGRAQIKRDSLWRKGFRSTSHCYSGCGAGEIVGVIIAVGLLSLSNWWVAGITFLLAYTAGFALTIGPLMQSGERFRDALRDTISSETASITVMEIVAISVDLWLAGNAKITDVIYWSSLIVSLTLGLLAAYPVNLWLIRMGIKEGMHNPRHMNHEHRHNETRVGQSAHA